MTAAAARGSMGMAATGAPTLRWHASSLPALVPYGDRGAPGVQPAARALNHPHPEPPAPAGAEPPVRDHRHPFAPAALAVVLAVFLH
ncbi:hypothetical protein ACWDOR_13680 [Streptosporangium canum]